MSWGALLGDDSASRRRRGGELLSSGYETTRGSDLSHTPHTKREQPYVLPSPVPMTACQVWSSQVTMDRASGWVTRACLSRKHTGSMSSPAAILVTKATGS